MCIIRKLLFSISLIYPAGDYFTGRIFSVRFLFTVCSLLFIIYSSYAQVPADSLPGIYAGQYWYANPATSPWVITSDTVYVSNIDSVNCITQFWSTQFSSQAYTYYTDYFSCNTPNPSNAYMKFYNNDSVRVIVDNYPQPYPHPPISFRFFGKRIGPIISGINDLALNKQVQIYPNPCSDKLNVECKILCEQACITITNILGKEIKKEKLLMFENTQVNISGLKEGIYFVRVQTPAGIFNKKIIIQ